MAANFQHHKDPIIHGAFVEQEGQKGTNRIVDNWYVEHGRERQSPIGRAVIIIVDELAFPVATELSEALRKDREC